MTADLGTDQTTCAPVSGRPALWALHAGKWVWAEMESVCQVFHQPLRGCSEWVGLGLVLLCAQLP